MIFINDKHINEKIYKIIKSKLIFCKDHNLLIYFKIVIIKLKILLKVIIEKINFLNFFENFNLNNDLFDVENVQ